MIDKIKRTVLFTHKQSTDPITLGFIDVIDTKSTYSYVQDVFDKISSEKEYTPTKGDKIYFYPDCTVPRFKIKQFCEKYNVSIVKYPDKANVRIAGPNTIGGMLISQSCRKVSKSEFLTYAQKYLPKDYFDLQKLNAEVTDTHVYMTYYVDGSFQKLTGAKIANDYTTIVLVKEGLEQKFKELASDPLIINEKEILRKLNTGSVMDNEQYVSIQRLFQSKDTENHKLAVEMMANCDFEKSSVYLLLLIHKFGDTIFNAPNRTHVNFKSLLKFFNAASDLRSMYLDKILERLIERKLLSAQNLNVVLPLLQEELESGGTSDYVKIKEVQVTEEVYKALEENILDKDHNTTIVEYNMEDLNPHL